MADEIDVLLGGGMTPQNTDTEMMAAMLRGQLNEGNALGMSTIGGVAQFGQGQADAARKSASQAGRLKAALEKEARAKQDAADEEAKAFKLWKKKQDYVQDNKLELEKLKKGLTGGNKLKPTAKPTQDYIKAKQLTGLIGAANQELAGMKPEQKEMLDNAKADVLTELFLPAAAERYVQDEYLYDDPQVKNYRARLADIESEFSRLMSGLAVTGFEMTDRQKWSPFASGIKQETREARLKNLYDKLKNQESLLEQTYDFGNIAGDLGQGTPMAQEPQAEGKTVTMAELQAMGATPEEAQAAGYRVVP